MPADAGRLLLWDGSLLRCGGEFFRIPQVGGCALQRRQHQPAPSVVDYFLRKSVDKLRQADLQGRSVFQVRKVVGSVRQKLAHWAIQPSQDVYSRDQTVHGGMVMTEFLIVQRGRAAAYATNLCVFADWKIHSNHLLKNIKTVLQINDLH
jgi:hypothetical protein